MKSENGLLTASNHRRCAPLPVWELERGFEGSGALLTALHFSTGDQASNRILFDVACNKYA
jgi:hypothetical protein